MINEDDFVETDETNETSETDNEESEGGYLGVEQIFGIEGMIIGSLNKLNQEEFNQFMSLWYAPAVDMAKKLKLDEALKKIVKIENPYITLIVGVGISTISAIMVIKQIKGNKKEEPATTVENPKVEVN